MFKAKAEEKKHIYHSCNRSSQTVRRKDWTVLGHAQLQSTKYVAAVMITLGFTQIKLMSVLFALRSLFQVQKILQYSEMI